MSAFNGFDLIIYLFGLVSILLSIGLVAFFLVSNIIEWAAEFKARLYGHATRFDGNRLH